MDWLIGQDFKNTIMRVKFWGVRGSIPAPLTSEQIIEKELSLLERIEQDGGMRKLFGRKPKKEDMRRYLQSLPLSLKGTYGGDTTCVEIQTRNSPLIMIDAGSGARELGRTLVGRLFGREHNLNPLNSDESKKRELHLFFTHYHWDHIQGFPFFTPAFLTGGDKINITFYGKKDARQHVSDVLKGQQQYPNFPVEWGDMPCNTNYVELPRLDNTRLIGIGNALVSYQQLSHPDSVFAYRISSGGRSFVFATDTEHRDIPDPRLVQFAKGADLLYYDAQYLPEEYPGKSGTVTGITPKIDWGHSTYEWAVKNALAASIPIVILGHHEPLRNDFGLEELAERATAFKNQQLSLPENQGKLLEVHLACQGLEYSLTAN